MKPLQELCKFYQEQLYKRANTDIGVSSTCQLWMGNLKMIKTSYC